MTTRDKLIELIEKPIKVWLEQTGSISKGTTYYAELMGCVQDSADELIKSGLIIDDKIYPPKFVLDKAFNCVEFYCSKCNKLVYFWEIKTLGGLGISKSDLEKENSVENLATLHHTYCHHCGCKLKE